MKSPSEITTISNELSYVTDQVSNSSISNDNTEQIYMKSSSKITKISNESSTQ